MNYNISVATCQNKGNLKTQHQRNFIHIVKEKTPQILILTNGFTGYKPIWLSFCFKHELNEDTEGTLSGIC